MSEEDEEAELSRRRARKLYHARYYIEHRDEITARKRELYAADLRVGRRSNEAGRAWREAHADEAREYGRMYRERNRERMRAYDREYRARKAREARDGGGVDGRG